MYQSSFPSPEPFLQIKIPQHTFPSGDSRLQGIWPGRQMKQFIPPLLLFFWGNKIRLNLHRWKSTSRLYTCMHRVAFAWLTDAALIGQSPNIRIPHSLIIIRKVLVLLLVTGNRDGIEYYGLQGPYYPMQSLGSVFHNTLPWVNIRNTSLCGKHWKCSSNDTREFGCLLNWLLMSTYKYKRGGQFDWCGWVDG